jgi:hypothetical protein
MAELKEESAYIKLYSKPEKSAMETLKNVETNS